MLSPTGFKPVFYRLVRSILWHRYLFWGTSGVIWTPTIGFGNQFSAIELRSRSLMNFLVAKMWDRNRIFLGYKSMVVAAATYLRYILRAIHTKTPALFGFSKSCKQSGCNLAYYSWASKHECNVLILVWNSVAYATNYACSGHGETNQNIVQNSWVILSNCRCVWLQCHYLQWNCLATFLCFVWQYDRNVFPWRGFLKDF